MGFFGILDVTAAGMDVQQKRLEVAASNLANANTSSGTPGALYKPLSVVVHSTQTDTVDGIPKPVVADIVENNLPPRLVYNPGHPDANERGFVALPGVDPVGMMLDLMSISRGYEANLRAFDVTRSLLLRTLELGSRR